MSIEASEYVVDEANAERLATWLDAGLWKRKEATLLFLDIDPDFEYGDRFSTFSGLGEVNYEYGDPDDPNTIVQYGVDQNDEPVYLTEEQDAVWDKAQRRCKKIERSLNLYESAQPHEWIELAREKGIAIPWLDWAIEKGLFIQKQVPGAVSTAPVVEGSVSEPRPAATGPVFTMKKAAMIEQHKHEWPTIEQDIKDAKRNGLSMAKAGERDWKEHEAMEWARNKGKLMSNDKPTQILAGAVGNMASLPTSSKHTLKG